MTIPTQIVPYGFCHCMCGSLAPISTYSKSKLGIAKGRPQQFIRGHNKRKLSVYEEAKAFKIDGVYCRFIPLTKGLIAIVNASDYLWLTAYTWHARFQQKTGRYYAETKIRIDGKLTSTSMQRMILGLKRGDPREGDHENLVNTLDNRRANLRVATKTENAYNTSLRKTNRSGFKNVFQESRRGKWVGVLMAGGHIVFREYFNNAETANEAVKNARKEFHGKFSRSK